MAFVIQIVGPASGNLTSSYDGQYVKAFDAEAHNGRGLLTASPDMKDAIGFNSPEDAFAFWQQTPKCTPHRSDGKPNRPLTFFTMEIVPRQH